MKKLFVSFIIIFCILSTQAQDTLPKISVYNRSGKIVLSWYNNYRDIIRISVQRSQDSLKGFRTISTLSNPNERINGYQDKNAPDSNHFYRLQIERWLDGVTFTKFAKPSLDSPVTDLKKFDNRNIVSDKGPFSDKGAVSNQSNSLSAISSGFVFITREGNVRITLADAKMKNYSIKFFRDNGSLALHLKRFREPDITLDKSNFMKAGWFVFE
ncbi:MAG: hypothetical protein ACO29O_09185, partial [Chitinophagaceae bacterium]